MIPDVYEAALMLGDNAKALAYVNKRKDTMCGTSGLPAASPLSH